MRPDRPAVEVRYFRGIAGVFALAGGGVGIAGLFRGESVRVIVIGLHNFCGHFVATFVINNYFRKG